MTDSVKTEKRPAKEERRKPSTYPDPLIILSPPRSFSSVVSTMIGEHPQLYGFPELHLFAGNTLDDLIAREARRGHPAPPGLIRTLAQELYGAQTQKTVTMAIAWFRQRKDWSAKRLFDYVLELVSPKIGVEKSPVTASSFKNLERAYAWFPKAYYLHLTRHPVSARSSIKEHRELQRDRQATRAASGKFEVDSLMVWYDMHKRIVRFLNTLPAGQWMRLKGEDVLSNPEVYLPQIAEWMGLRTDHAAIDAMLHPEHSPYACMGPRPVRGGNDTKFIRSPTLRKGVVREPSLEKFFGDSDWDWASKPFIKSVEASGFEKSDPGVAKDRIRELAHFMGYC